MHKHTLIAALVSIAATLAPGCTYDEGYDDVPTDSLYARLGTREALVLEPTSLVGVNAYDDDGNPLPCVQPTVTGGDAMLRSTKTGLLLVEALQIHLTDVTIQPGVLHSEPVRLTDIELRLGTQIVIEADWSDDGLHAEGVGRADLLMDWAVLSDQDEVLPLATQKLRQVEFTVRADLDDQGDIHVQVYGEVEGKIGGFANRIELSDFSMAVNAVTAAPAPL
ncbi:MAG TPA: hypothetical protein VML75_03925 [Kofleriaceae bacterium]|nr:hypothetical protein [Kofleriaceae bacterium]